MCLDTLDQAWNEYFQLDIEDTEGSFNEEEDEYEEDTIED